MKKKIFVIPMLLSIVFMSSCDSPNIFQMDWHINNLELADEYFPKYFEAIEDSLKRNNFKYEKEYSEKNHEQYAKIYNATYFITDTILFKTTFYFDCRFNNRYTYLSAIEFRLYYESQMADEVLNLSQNYINVMEDVTHFCSYNFLETNG